MTAIYYRTKDGRADYSFSFEQVRDGYWRAYIMGMPSYGTRRTDASTTHRLSEGGRSFVCWSGSLKSEEDARQVAKKWADMTQVYIRTGVTIDEQVRRGWK